MQNYRPPNQNASSTYSEKKNRLNEVFAYKGGRALPNELTKPISISLTEVKEQEKEEARMLKAKASRINCLHGCSSKIL